MSEMNATLFARLRHRGVRGRGWHPVGGRAEAAQRLTAQPLPGDVEGT